MVLYPIICVWLGFDAQRTGVMLGATIHDVAQVVGAGYAVSETTGNTAVIVKLFRVFLLFPVVLVIGWSFARHAVTTGRGKDPGPGLCYRVRPVVPAQQRRRVLSSLRADQSAVDRGIHLGTSDRHQRARSRHLPPAIAALGWRHVATVTGTTVVILVVMTAGLMRCRSRR